MNVDIVTVDSKTIGINFTGATSGRKIVSDYMNDIQGKYDVRGGKAAGDANIYFAFFRKFWMNAVGHVATLPTAEVWAPVRAACTQIQRSIRLPSPPITMISRKGILSL